MADRSKDAPSPSGRPRMLATLIPILRFPQVACDPEPSLKAK